MLRVGSHVRAVLAAAVIGTLGANMVLLGQPTTVSAGQAQAPVTSTSTTTVPTTISLTELAPVAFARVQEGGGVRLPGGDLCSPESLELSFDDPGTGWVSGAHVSPLGPAPTVWTTSVNGIVRCAGSRHAYVGFMAVRTTGWDVELVPDVDLDRYEPIKVTAKPKPKPPSHDKDDGPAKNKPDTAPKPKPAPAAGPIVGKLDGPAIEGYARYDGQAICDPAAKPGTLALRNMLLSRYPATSSGGISRACEIGGKSEHKEGRAFDWGAHIGNAAQRAAVDDFLRFLFATDSYGHQHALARRMGVMYVIWNQHIWHAYRADLGWQPYTGTSPHTDHVHISLSWAGARAETSYYSGTVVPGLPDSPMGGAKPPSGKPGKTPKPSTTTTSAPDGRGGGGGRGWRPGPTTSTTATPTSSSTSTPGSTTTTSIAPAATTG